MKNLWLHKVDAGYILVDFDAEIPKYSVFYVPGNDKTFVNYNDNISFKKDWQEYLLVLAATFPIDGLKTQKEFEMLLQAELIRKEIYDK